MASTGIEETLMLTRYGQLIQKPISAVVTRIH